jgi:PEGA domain-containing protein
MQTLRRPFALLLCAAVMAYGQGNAFTRVRYNGGSISTKVKPDEWDNKLTVNSDSIVFALKDGQSITIQPKQVTSLSYGQEAHRRVGTAIGIGLLTLGAGALFMFHKTKLHFIGVNYTDANGKNQGLLLQGDKSNFRAIIVALQGVTGVPVSISEKERGEIPAGVAIQSVKEPEQPKPTSAQPAQQQPPAQAAPQQPAQMETETHQLGTVRLVSTPDGAEVYVDGAFVGNVPAVLKLPAGKHTIRVSKAGFKDWSREITVQTESDVSLAASLEKQD